MCRAAPSSDPSGHLLPEGEEGIETLRHIPFSPAGRRWPEGSDEGGHTAGRSFALRLRSAHSRLCRSPLTPPQPDLQSVAAPD
ncbi:hypothetical protein B5P46_07980 [Rhizobium leguminosarum]|uniref:Uncharacterized protein n=1 Tax=Rhizobium leguminosarum TaxID=384 RepID=A0A4Q1U9Z3_RHILE|nr:hypothetical protein B5P46_07980 [Rhizobium leguminosarum]